MPQTVLAPIDTPERAGYRLNLPVAAAVHLYPGTIGARDASGNLTYATDTAGVEVMGRIEDDVDNSAGSAAALNCNVRRSAFLFVNSASNALTKADVGKHCYVQDEQTVCNLTGSTNKVKAGIFLGLDPDDGRAIVDMRGTVQQPMADTLTALTFSSTPTQAEVVALRNAIVTALVGYGALI